MHLNDLVEKCFEESYDRGWWNDFGSDNLTPENVGKYIIGTKFALIHSEISEAMEAFRKGTMDDHIPYLPGINVELADACIRIFDLAGRLNIDLEHAIEAKMKYNKDRIDHDLEYRQSEHGKKF
jgi:NTP pyrophosphatase (non-canonical NTP hydrolase)